MVYLLYGKEEYLIEKEIEKITKSEEIDPLNVTRYDLEIDNIDDILEDAMTMSLFCPKKVIIVENSIIFSGSKNDLNYENIDKYLDNPNTSTILIFKLISEKLDNRKKITTKIKKQAIVKEFNNINKNMIIKNLFEDYEIDLSLINILIDRVGNDLNILKQEINKIKIYKGDNKKITKEDIINLTSKNIDIDIFSLIENIINKNKLKSLEIYYEMLKYNIEPIKIIIMLANQFRIIYQAKELYKKGYTGNDIASILNIHPYRIKLALEKSYNYNNKDLLKYLNSLADMDLNIKSGLISSDLALELFILEI